MRKKKKKQPWIVFKKKKKLLYCYVKCFEYKIKRRLLHLDYITHYR